MILIENFYIIILFLFLNIFLYFLKDNFYKKFLPLDKPSGRKIHTNPVLISGGFIFYINVMFFILITNFGDQIFENFNQTKIIFVFSLTAFFLLGLFDDKINLNGTLKLILIIAFIYFFLLNNDKFLITELKFSFSEKSINLGWFSIYFTILCIALFINSFNMFDGINLQSGFYSLTFFLFFILNDFNILFCILFLFPHIVFLLKNYKNKSFLGDGGCYVLSFLISLFIINYYKNDYIKSDQIFLLMMIPGIDMLRLFIVRIAKKKNPFSGDNKHFHHRLLDNFTSINTFYIIFLINFLNFVFVFFDLSSLTAFFVTLTIYLFFCFKYKFN